MKKVITLVVVIVSIVTFYYFKSNQNSNKVLRLSITNDLVTFDPAVAFNDDSLIVLSQIYEPLYQYHYLKRPLEVTPLLADDLPEISEDGKKITINIKKNIPYHTHEDLAPGRVVKAQDFVNQIKRIAFNPVKSNGKWLFQDNVIGFKEFAEKAGESWDKFFELNIEGVKVKSDYSFEILLKNKDTRLNFFLAMNFVVPIPEEVIKAHKGNFSKQIVGTGPFYFSGRKKGQFIQLKKFNRYRKDFYPNVGDRYANINNLLDYGEKRIPFLEEILFSVDKDINQKWHRFLKGDIDLIDVPKEYISELDLKGSNINNLIQDKEVIHKNFSGMSSRWLAFNMKDKVLGSNLELRKAISFAIDRDKYVEKIFNNTVMKANSIYVPGINGYDPTHTLPYDYDVEQAKKLLAEAGYPNGNGLAPITYSTRSKSKQAIWEAKLVQEQLSKIGIKVNIQELEFKDFLKLGRAGKLQFFTDQWIYDYPDAENLVQLLITKNFPGTNKAGFSNQKLDQLYTQLFKVQQPDQRKKILTEIESIVKQQIPWIKLSYESVNILYRKNVKNVRRSSVIRNFLKYIDITN